MVQQAIYQLRKYQAILTVNELSRVEQFKLQRHAYLVFYRVCPNDSIIQRYLDLPFTPLAIEYLIRQLNQKRNQTIQ